MALRGKPVPSVSVIIPTYNRADMLAQAMRSVLAQTLEDYELIIIDDGSTDNTREVVEQFSDPRIRYIRQNNQERSAARNNGVAQSSGEYIAFLDSDDIWFPRKLELQIPELDRNPNVGLVHGYCVRISEHGRFDYPQDFTRKNSEPVTSKARDEILAGNMVLTPAVVIRKELYERSGGFDMGLRLAEDWDLWIRISEMCDFCFIAKPLAAFRVHSGNSMRNLRQLSECNRVVIDRYVKDAESAVDLAIKLDLSNAFSALWSDLECAGEYFSLVRERLAESADMVCRLEDLLLNYAVSNAQYTVDSLDLAARVLKCAADYMLCSSRMLIQRYWANWVHLSYALGDGSISIHCIRRLIADCGICALDRGILSIYARSIVAGSSQRIRFPEEVAMDEILMENGMRPLEGVLPV